MPGGLAPPGDGEGGCGPASEPDKTAVRQAAYDYAEGYYEGAAHRMERAVDAVLNKRGLIARPGSQPFLTPMNAEMLIEATRGGAGKNTPADARGLSFTLLDIRETVASAKIFTATFNDYLHLAKQNGQWRLVNRLTR